MAKRTSLTLAAAAGCSLESARIFAGKPDAIEDDTFAQVWMLGLAGDRLEVIAEIPHPIFNAWMSPNGTLYCTCADGFVAVCAGGVWSREKVGAPHSPPQRLFGFAGVDSRRDIVVACSNSGLHVRRDGSWAFHAFPEEVEMAFGLHGLSPDSIYVCSDAEGLHKWNGGAFEYVDMPFHEEPSGVLVTAPDDLLVTADDIHLRVDGAWSTPEHPGSRPTIAVAQLGSDAYVGTRDGVLRHREGSFELVQAGYCNLLAGVGDGLIAGEAFEGTQVRVFDGSSWRSVDLPAV